MKGLIKSTLFFILFITTGCYGSSVESVVKKSEDKVVKIGIVGEKGEGIGSGAVISSDGAVITCDHLFWHPYNKIFVKTSDGTVYNGVIEKESKIKDLALVRIQFTEKFPHFKHFLFGKDAKKGQQVVSFGSPLGLQGTISVGWIENILEKTDLLLIHSAFVNPGNSGGPLVDLHGRLVGVNEAVLMQNFFFPAQGLYIAISVETVKEFLNDGN